MSSPVAASPTGADGGAPSAGGEAPTSPTATQLNLQLKEVTSMLQERTDELSTLRTAHHELKSAHDAATARISSLEASLAAAQSGGGGGDSSAALQAKDAELAALKSRNSDMLNKLERLESEVLSARKLGEAAAARVEREKDDEIVALKEMFTEVSEKRKESFLQLKDKLRQASEMLSKNAAQYAADQQTLEALRRQLQATEAALKEKNAQVSDYDKRVHDLEHEKGDLFQRTSDELQKSKSEVREQAAKLEAAQRDLQAAQHAAKLQSEKDERQHNTEMVLESEGGICENGRTIRVVGAGITRDTPVQWYRSFRGSAFLPIPGRSLTTSLAYTPTVDDIGSVLRAEILVGSHGEQNIPVYREIGPVGIKRVMIAAMQEHMKKSEITLQVEKAHAEDGGASTAAAGKKGGSDKDKPAILLTKDKIKLREGGKTLAKSEWSEGMQVTLDPDSSTRFLLRVDASANPVSYAVANSTERDLTVQLIRLYAALHTPNKTHPSDNMLAIAYLIRAANEQQALAALKAMGPAGAPPRLRHGSEDGFGFGEATGLRKNSNDSPHFAGLQARQNLAASAAADTPQSSVNGGGFGFGSSKGSAGTSAHVAGGAAAAYSAAAASSGSASAPSEPVAVAKIQGSNGEELEVDADGFVIRRDKGWGDEKPAGGDKKQAAAGAAGEGGAAPDVDDDGFSADEDDGLDAKPSFQMKINSEARPLASAADLRRHSMLVAPGALPPLSDKEAKRKAKAEKKEKKEKKKHRSAASGEGAEEGGLDALGSPHPADGTSTPQPEASPSSSQQQQQPAPTPLSVNAFASVTALSPQAGASGGHSVSQQGAQASASQAPANADDLFAFFDQESSAKAPPELGATPKAAPAAAATPRLSLSGPAGSPMSASAAPAAETPSKKPAPPAAGPAPTPRSQLTSPRSPLKNSVDILVMETLHARVLDGEVIEYAVWGEILLNLALPIPFSPARFDFQLFNTDAISKLAPNSAVLTSGGAPGAWVATIPAGTDAPLCVLKYKVNTELAQAKRQVPLQLSTRWTCTSNDTTLDVSYRMNPTSKTPLTDVKFLVSLQPDKCIKQCTLAAPKCMWSPASQKCMWQVPALPTSEGVSSGTLHAEWLNEGGLEAQPQPMSLSFMSEDLDSVISGLLITEAEKAGPEALPLGRMIYRIKSGIYSVL